MSGEALFEAQIDVRIEKTRVIQKASEEAQKKPPSSSESPVRVYCMYDLNNKT